MLNMSVDELQAIMEELFEERGLPIGNLSVDFSKNKELIIRTGLRLDADGELIGIDEDLEEDDNEFEDREDFEPLEDEDVDDDE